MLSRSEATIKTYGMHDISYHSLAQQKVQAKKAKYIYAVTISKHQKKDFVDKIHLNSIITQLKLNNYSLHFIDYVYENSGKYNQLHFHGTALANQKINYIDNTSINGFRIQWKPIINLNGWYEYIHKEIDSPYKQEQIFYENYYKHNKVL